MRSLSSDGYDTDKSRSYLRNYDKYFADFPEPLNILELGIFHGGSLLLWRDHIQGGNVVGLDRKNVEVPDESGRRKVYKGSQDDTALLERIGNETGPFDIIIDDASHLAAETKVGFWWLFERHLKPGGLYVIEDWRVGYYGAWPDGKQYKQPRDNRGLFGRARRVRSHDFGLVGFVKQLVDELGADAYTHPSRGSREANRLPRFRSMEFTPGLVFIVKASPEDDALVREQWAKAKSTR